MARPFAGAGRPRRRRAGNEEEQFGAGQEHPASLKSRRRDDGSGEAVRSVVSGLRTGSRVLDGLAVSSLMACLWQPRADHEQKHELGDVTITRGLDATRPITEALQLRSRVISESLAHHDSWIMDDGWVGRGDAGAVGVVVAGCEGAHQALVPAGTH